MIYEDYPGKGSCIGMALFFVGAPAIAWWFWITAPLEGMPPCHVETLFGPIGISLLFLPLLWMLRGNFAIAWGSPQPKYSPWAAEILGVDAYGNPCKYYNTSKKKKKSNKKKKKSKRSGCGDKCLTR